MKKTYTIPIKLEIDDENPDKIARLTAEEIYKTINRFANNLDRNGIKFFDMEYRIYIKPNAVTFGT